MNDQRWKSLGRVYAPDPTVPQRQLYGILPTPLYLADRDAIEIFFAATDASRIGRMYSLIVDAANPTRILEGPGQALLDAGPPGAFDDCGINPCSVVSKNGRLDLYYIGYQRSVASPYLLFSGRAISRDGRTFERSSNVPVLDRTNDEYIIRSALCAMEDGDGYRGWYVSATGWDHMTNGLFAGRTMPLYVVRHARSRDGVSWSVDPEACITPESDEFGIGRPWVVRSPEGYRMYYSIRSRTRPYRIGYAESTDGLHWTRKDDALQFISSGEQWDSEMACYAAVIETPRGALMFYNGNRNGETGFGCAVLA